jgi:hypothetical protein
MLLVGLLVAGVADAVTTVLPLCDAEVDLEAAVAEFIDASSACQPL